MSEASKANKKAFANKLPGSSHPIDKRVQSLTLTTESSARKKSLRLKLWEFSAKFNQGKQSWSIARMKTRVDSRRLNFMESIRIFDVRVRSHEKRYSFLKFEGNKNTLRHGTATNSLRVFDKYYKIRIPEGDIWPKMFRLRFPPAESEHHVTVDESSDRYKTAREADPDSICVCRTKQPGYASSWCDCTSTSNTPYAHTPSTNTPRTHVPYIYVPRNDPPDSATSRVQTPESHAPGSHTLDAHMSGTRRPRSRTRRARTRRSRSHRSHTSRSHSPDSHSPDSGSTDSHSSDSRSPGSRSSDSDLPDSDSPEGRSLEIIDMTRWEEDESLRPLLYDHDFDTFTSPYEKKAEAIAMCLQGIKDMGVVRLFPQISPTRLFIQAGPHPIWRNIIPGGWAWGLRPLYTFSLVAAQDIQDYDLDDLAGATDHTILAQGESFKTFKLALRSLKEVVSVALTVKPDPFMAGTDNVLRYTHAEERLSARVNVFRRMRGLPALPFTVESPGLEALKAICSGCKHNRPELSAPTDPPTGLDAANDLVVVSQS